MSRGLSQVSLSNYQHLVKTEHVVRLECERREAKARARLMDVMMAELEDQLLYVSQFKKEWVRSRKKMEAERVNLMTKESASRTKIEEKYVRKTNELIQANHPIAIMQAKKSKPARAASSTPGTASAKR